MRLRITEHEGHDVLAIEGGHERARIAPPAPFAVVWRIPEPKIALRPRPAQTFRLRDPFGEFELRVAA